MIPASNPAVRQQLKDALLNAALAGGGALIQNVVTPGQRSDTNPFLAAAAGGLGGRNALIGMGAATAYNSLMPGIDINPGLIGAGVAAYPYLRGGYDVANAMPDGTPMANRAWMGTKTAGMNAYNTGRAAVPGYWDEVRAQFGF